MGSEVPKSQDPSKSGLEKTQSPQEIPEGRSNAHIFARPTVLNYTPKLTHSKVIFIYHFRPIFYGRGLLKIWSN